jgi:hypothetical protein
VVSHGRVCDYGAKSLERRDGKSQLIDGINCLLTLVAFVKEELLQFHESQVGTVKATFVQSPERVVLRGSWQLDAISCVFCWWFYVSAV